MSSSLSHYTYMDSFVVRSVTAGGIAPVSSRRPARRCRCALGESRLYVAVLPLFPLPFSSTPFNDAFAVHQSRGLWPGVDTQSF